jgi:hypothetical protein
MLFSSILSAFALAAAGVHAHGYVSEITLDGKTYKGPVAGGAKIKSPVRQISTTSPWKDVNGAGMTCGRNAQNAQVVAPVTAGSTASLKWVDHPGTNWQHDMGPLITYMAKVPSGQTADKFNAAQGNFFKIAQFGQEGKSWTQAKLMKGAAHSFQIPKGIENGDYILRHEIVALHLANKRGGAEFYTSCIQVRVTGGSAGKVNVTPTAKFPGGYSASDPGIFTPKIFDGGFKYSFPGPAMPKFSGAGGAGVKSTNNTASTTTKSRSTKPTPGAGKSKHRRGWMSRLEKRFVGVPAPAPVSE